MRPILIALSKIGERKRVEFRVPSIFPKVVLFSKICSSFILTYLWTLGLPSSYLEIHRGAFYLAFLTSAAIGMIPEYYCLVSIKETLKERKRRLYELFHQISKAFEMDPRFSEKEEVLKRAEGIKEKSCLFRQIPEPPWILTYMIAVGVALQLIPMPEIVWSLSISLELLGLFTFFSYLSRAIYNFMNARRACLGSLKELLDLIGVPFSPKFSKISTPPQKLLYPSFLAIPFIPPSSIPLSALSSVLMIKAVRAYNLEIKEEWENEEILGEILSKTFRSKAHFFELL